MSSFQRFTYQHVEVQASLWRSEQISARDVLKVFFQANMIVLIALLAAGNVRFANGDRYTGDFLKGQPHGHGRSVTNDGDRYTGDWKAGKRHGKGRSLFANGDKYQGEPSPKLIG